MSAPSTVQVETPGDEYYPPGRRWLVAGAVVLGSFLTILDSSIINVALPYMEKSFGVGVDQITWVVTSYLVAIGVMIPLTGWLAARIGRKRYFLISVAMFVAASALCGVANGLPEMVFFRVLQGAAGAAMSPLSQAIILETFPPHEHTLAMSTIGIGTIVAPVFGPTLGGWITMNWSWRWNFYINIPMGAIAAMMVYAFVHDPPYLRQQRGSGRIDYKGIIYVLLSIGLLELLLNCGGQAGWFAATWVRYASLVCVVAFVLLVRHELSFSDPILDLRMLKIFGFALSVGIISVHVLVMFSVNLLNPLFLQEVLGYTAEQAGIAVGPRGVGVLVALVAVGQLSRRGYDMRPMVAAGFVLGAYEIWQMSHWNMGTTTHQVLWTIFIFGLGLGVVFPTITASGLGQIRRERIGFASSLFNMMINTGAASGIAIVGNMLTAHQQRHQAELIQYFGSLKASGIPLTPNSASATTFQFLHQLGGGRAGEAVMISHAITSQSWLLAYTDIYRTLAVVLLCLAPCCLLFKRMGGVSAISAVD